MVATTLPTVTPRPVSVPQLNADGSASFDDNGNPVTVPADLSGIDAEIYASQVERFLENLAIWQRNVALGDDMNNTRNLANIMGQAAGPI